MISLYNHLNAQRSKPSGSHLQALNHSEWSSRSSKYLSLSNSHNMLITLGYYVDLFKTPPGRNTLSLGQCFNSMFKCITLPMRLMCSAHSSSQDAHGWKYIKCSDIIFGGGSVFIVLIHKEPNSSQWGDWLKRW